MKETLGKSTRLCITVLGSSSVGKTALTVRYLTGRFIGEYYSGSDMTYHQSVPYLGGSLTTNVDIVDISRPNETNGDNEPFLCTDKTNAFLVVYSLTSSRSFDRAQEILSRLPFNAPKYLIANQLDLQHRRQVTRVEGQTLADQFGCPFDEFSAAEPVGIDASKNHVKTAFQKLIRQLISHSHVLPCPRIRFSAFSKLLGSFVAKTRHAATNNNHNKLQRGVSHNSSKSSVSSGSCGSTCSGSDISLATITSETSLLTISSSSNDDSTSKPIPIVSQKINGIYPSSNHQQIASI